MSVIAVLRYLLLGGVVNNSNTWAASRSYEQSSRILRRPPCLVGVRGWAPPTNPAADPPSWLGWLDDLASGLGRPMEDVAGKAVCPHLAVWHTEENVCSGPPHAGGVRVCQRDTDVPGQVTGPPCRVDHASVGIHEPRVLEDQIVAVWWLRISRAIHQAWDVVAECLGVGVAALHRAAETVGDGP